MYGYHISLRSSRGLRLYGKGLTNLIASSTVLVHDHPVAKLMFVPIRTDGSDFMGTQQLTVMFPSGSDNDTTANITIGVVDDDVPEPVEEFRVRIVQFEANVLVHRFPWIIVRIHDNDNFTGNKIKS